MGTTLRPLAVVLLLFTSILIPAKAQDLVNELGSVLGNKLAAKGAVLRQQLDSIDFQFAISLNKGAGFFDIQQKGEVGSKFLYSIREEDQKTMLEKARDSLEVGLGMYNIRRYETAEQQLQVTKELMEAYDLTEEIVYLRLISSLGLIYLTQGKTGNAENYIGEGLRRSEQTLGKASPAYIANLNNMAKLHQVLGKYNEAEKEFDEAIRLASEVFGGGVQQAILLNNKAMLFQVLGQYDKAIIGVKASINAASLTPKKTLQGDKSYDNRKFEANLASVYQQSGQFALAQSKFDELKKIFENRRQTKNAEYAGILNQMGILAVQMGESKKAQELLTNAATVYKRIWGENTIYFAAAVNDLGSYYRLQGDYSNAGKWLNKAYTIRKQLLEDTHPDFIKTEEDLAIMYWKSGKIKEANALYKKVMTKTLDKIANYFPPMSEAEKTKYWDITSPRFQRFYNFALENRVKYPELISDLYRYNIATKGLLLTATSKVREVILNSGDSDLIADYTNWRDQKEQLARMYTYSKRKRELQNIDLVALEEEANDLEKSLSERSTSFAKAFEPVGSTIESIQRTLREYEVIVDVIRIRGFDQDFNDQIYYAAMILKGGSAEMVVIEEGADLEQRHIKFYRNTVKRKIEDTNSYPHFWEPIAAKLDGINKIYLSPDGVYNEININTLLTPTGKYLIEDYDLTLIGNSKDVKLLRAAKDASLQNAFLLGSPDYSNSGVSMLPGTLVEINAISGILKDNGYSIASYLNREASEENIKKLNSPQLVHIATHGFFMEDVKNGSGSVFGIEAENASANPLLRSGLLLSGISNNLSDTLSADISNVDNGILTAYEAMNLNLEGTSLVVLSACETALGDIKSGEGVYGLQRAFQIAGAHALIMSLWKVDDAATQKLMSLFYANWVKSGDKHSAFRNAQLQLKEEYREPVYWGAFVMIGG